jgi:predicted transport protein
VAVEKSLQTLIERNLPSFLGIKFLASEHSTGKNHGGRIDTLGIDENGFPVIIEYKRSLNENVINQGLFYLDWLMDHKAEFELMVLKKLGQKESNGIEWSNPRLICVAGDFTKYDEHAVQQINRNIDLIRYKRYGDELLLLELVNSVSADSPLHPTGKGSSKQTDKTAADQLAQSDTDLRDRFEALKAFLLSLGDDVTLKETKLYFAFKRIKNFASVEVHGGTKDIVIYIKVDPTSITLEQGFTRDVRMIGHWGTGNLEIVLKTTADLERAKPLLLQSYELS